MGSNAEASLDASRRPDTVVVFGGPAASFLGRPRPRFTPVLLVGVQFPPGDRAVGEREARFGIGRLTIKCDLDLRSQARRQRSSALSLLTNHGCGGCHRRRWLRYRCQGLGLVARGVRYVVHEELQYMKILRYWRFVGSNSAQAYLWNSAEGAKSAGANATTTATSAIGTSWRGRCWDRRTRRPHHLHRCRCHHLRLRCRCRHRRCSRVAIGIAIAAGAAITITSHQLVHTAGGS